MNDLTKQDTLELEVANFGPIIEAKIDLRPLTVFVGPSNTGKSYLAILTYALHRFFSGFRGYRMFPSIEHQKLPRRTIDAIDEWAQQTFVDKKVEESFVLSPPIIDVIRSVLDAQGDQLSNEIGRCFGIDETGTLIRKGISDGGRIIFRRHVSNDAASSEHRLTLNVRGTEFGTIIPKGMSMQIDVGKWDKRMYYLRRYAVENMVAPTQRRDEDWDFSARRLIEILIDLTLPQLVGPLHRPAFYLPAGRTGVIHAHTDVTSMPLGVLKDFLRQLIAIDPPPYKRRKSRRDLGMQIEEAILGGAIRVERSETIGYPHFTYQPKGMEGFFASDEHLVYGVGTRAGGAISAL